MRGEVRRYSSMHPDWVIGDIFRQKPFGVMGPVIFTEEPGVDDGIAVNIPVESPLSPEIESRRRRERGVVQQPAGSRSGV